MITCKIETFAPFDVVFGRRLPAPHVYRMPLVEFASIKTDEFAATSTDKAAVGPAPKCVLDAILALLPVHGVADEGIDDPELRKLAASKMQPVTGPEWLAYNAEIAVRKAGLDDIGAFAVVAAVPGALKYDCLAAVQTAREAGFCVADHAMRVRYLADKQEREEAEEAARLAAEKAAALQAEKLDIMLGKFSLVGVRVEAKVKPQPGLPGTCPVFISDILLGGRPPKAAADGSRILLWTLALPQHAERVQIAPGIALLSPTSTVELTRAEFAAIRTPAPLELEMIIADARGAHTEALPGPHHTLRSIEGRHAAEEAAGWVRKLVPVAGTREGRWAHALLWDLPTAFYPYLHPDVLSDMVEETLSGMASNWHCQPASVRAKPTTAEHVWATGELWREPSAEDRIRLREELQPKLLEQTIAALAHDRDEVTNEECRTALIEVGLVEGALNKAQNARLAATLEELGWQYKIVGHGAASEDGPGRHRCWRRKDATDAAAQ